MTKIHFEENSRLVSDSAAPVTSENAIAVGRAAAAAFGKPQSTRICIGRGTGPAAEALSLALASGVCAAGGEAVIAGQVTAPGLSFSVKRLGCDIGVYVTAGMPAAIRLFAADGLRLLPRDEKKIEAMLNIPPEDCAYEQYGGITSCEGISQVYLSRLSEILSGRLEKISAQFYSPSETVIANAQRLLAGKNGKADSCAERIAFHIDADGCTVSAYTDDTGHVPCDKLAMLCCMELFSSGQDIASCGELPEAAAKLAEVYGRRVMSCQESGSGCHDETEQTEKCRQTRSACAAQLFLHDGTATALTVLEMLRRRDISLKAALDELPPYALAGRYIPVSGPHELILSLGSADGVLMNSESGHVTVRPVRTGKGIMLSVESFAAETAAELCDFYADMISAEDKKKQN